MKTVFTMLLASIGLLALAQNYQPISVFPNPATDRLFVHVPESFSGPTQIYISDLNGRVYYSKQQSLDEYDQSTFRRVEIFIGDIPTGYYIINIRNADDWRAEQFAKK